MNKDTLNTIFWIAFFIVACTGVGTCKAWQYDECMAVGHGETYCAAVAAGCMGNGK